MRCLARGQIQISHKKGRGLSHLTAWYYRCCPLQSYLSRLFEYQNCPRGSWEPPTKAPSPVCEPSRVAMLCLKLARSWGRCKVLSGCYLQRVGGGDRLFVEGGQEGLLKGLSGCAHPPQHWLQAGGCRGRQCPGGHGPAAERHTAAKTRERTQENPAGGSGLGLATMAAFAFCTQLRGQLVPAGCRQKEKVPTASPGVLTGRKTVFLSLCKSSDLVLGEVKRCVFESGWSGSSAAPRAAQRHWCAVATPLPALLLSPVCLPVSLRWQHTASPAVSSSFQPALFGRWALERLYFCGCSLTCAFLLPCVTVVHM